MIKVLVVEDQKLFLGALANLINLEADFDVIGTAENGQQALALIDTKKPDLVITDIEMPRTNGYRANTKNQGIIRPYLRTDCHNFWPQRIFGPRN